MYKQGHQQKCFFPVNIFCETKGRGKINLYYIINMYKQDHQQKWFFPCKHIFVKLKEEENLIYIILYYITSHHITSHHISHHITSYHIMM